MKLPWIHRSAFSAVGVIFLFALPAASQLKLAERDKSQIIRAVLSSYDFNHTEMCCDNAENTILLLDQNISSIATSSRKDVKFKIVNQDEIDRLRKTETGIEYYEFRPFEITKTGVRTFFIRTYVSPTGGNGSAMEYTCRKVGGRWKLKARLDGVWAT